MAKSDATSWGVAPVGFWTRAIVWLKWKIAAFFRFQIESYITGRILAYHQGLREDGFIGPALRCSSEERILRSSLSLRDPAILHPTADHNENRTA